MNLIIAQPVKFIRAWGTEKEWGISIDLSETPAPESDDGVETENFNDVKVVCIEEMEKTVILDKLILKLHTFTDKKLNEIENKIRNETNS